MGESVLPSVMSSTPFLVVDVETTGLSTRSARIIEMALVVLREGRAPEVVLDTMVNPAPFPMGCSEIHGITDGDVATAPTFSSLVPLVMSALANRVVVAHHADFDVELLRSELARCGAVVLFPYLCTMRLPMTVDPAAKPRSLGAACAFSSIPLRQPHGAREDALAASRLLQAEIADLSQRGIETFGDLVVGASRRYEYLHSLTWPCVAAPPVIHNSRDLHELVVSRRQRRVPAKPIKPIATYLRAVVAALADLVLEPAELEDLVALRNRLELTPAEIRAVHAKVLHGMLDRFLEDSRVDDEEVDQLQRARSALSRLGWAPGDDALGIQS